MFHNDTTQTVEAARWLGAASIGLGICELAHPQCVENMLGINDNPTHRGVLRALGVRELMHGVGLLTEEAPTQQLSAGLWSRVAGDVLDGALLAVAATKTKHPARFLAVAAAVAAIGCADLYFARKASCTRAQRRRYGLSYH